MRPSEIARLTDDEIRTSFLRLTSATLDSGLDDAALLLQLRADLLGPLLLENYELFRRLINSEHTGLAGAAYTVLVRNLSRSDAPAFLEKVRAAGDGDLVVTLYNARPDLHGAINAIGRVVPSRVLDTPSRRDGTGQEVATLPTR